MVDNAVVVCYVIAKVFLLDDQTNTGSAMPGCLPNKALNLLTPPPTGSTDHS